MVEALELDILLSTELKLASRTDGQDASQDFSAVPAGSRAEVCGLRCCGRCGQHCRPYRAAEPSFARKPKGDNAVSLLSDHGRSGLLTVCGSCCGMHVAHLPNPHPVSPLRCPAPSRQAWGPCSCSAIGTEGSSFLPTHCAAQHATLADRGGQQGRGATARAVIRTEACGPTTATQVLTLH